MTDAAKNKEALLDRLAQKAGDYEELFGSCRCHGVQQHIFGRHFDLMDPDDGKAFVQADASKKCRIPVSFAARVAGELILASS